MPIRMPGNPSSTRRIYVDNIRDALSAADPGGAEVFASNAEAYLAKLDALDREVRECGRPNSARTAAR